MSSGGDLDEAGGRRGLSDGDMAGRLACRDPGAGGQLDGLAISAENGVSAHCRDAVEIISGRLRVVRLYL